MPLSISTLRAGDQFEKVVVENLSRSQIVMYAGASGDFHPVHSDETYAKAIGLPGVFAHGMLTMGMTGTALTDFVGDNRLKKYSARFKGQVWPGDTLTAKIIVESIDTENLCAQLKISTYNQDGKEVLSGSAQALLYL